MSDVRAFGLWLKDTLERSAATFVVGLLALVGTDALSDFDADWGKRLGTAGIVAVAAFLTNAALPDRLTGNAWLDVAIRASWSAIQAGAVVVVLAGTSFAWYEATAWQAVGVAALAAAASAVKGALAASAVAKTISPASFAKAA